MLWDTIGSRLVYDILVSTTYITEHSRKNIYILSYIDLVHPWLLLVWAGLAETRRLPIVTDICDQVRRGLTYQRETQPPQNIDLSMDQDSGFGLAGVSFKAVSDSVRGCVNIFMNINYSGPSSVIYISNQTVLFDSDSIVLILELYSTC